jgi:hypothetical protein
MVRVRPLIVMDFDEKSLSPTALVNGPSHYSVSSLPVRLQLRILYLALSTFSDFWTSQYHESISVSGLHYISMCLDEVAGAEIGGPLLDMMFHRMKS